MKNKKGVNMIKKEEIKEILNNNDLLSLIKLANDIYKKNRKKDFELCSIINAKSGACSEDCKFCAQSIHWKTEIEVYPLKKRDEILKEAEIARKNRAERFGIVTSGRGISDKDIEEIANTIYKMKKEIGIEPCASLGEITEKQLKILKDAGLTRYHHNIETSKNYYPNIVTTHKFEDRIKTIKLVKNSGMEICSGGIIGLGESMDDRIDMALTLDKLNVDGVPINILVPIKGTPLENQEPLSIEEIIRTIAIFRIILKDKIIKIAAGRESKLKDFQSLAFLAGANGMLIGGYLTIRGRSVEDDIFLTENLLQLL